MTAGSDGFDDCVATLAASGLPPPPIPRELAARLVRRGPWNWSTIADPTAELAHPYHLEGYVMNARERGTEDFTTVAHCGHGANSWALAFYLVKRPLYLFVHQEHGGAYMNDDRTARAIGEAYGVSAALLDAVRVAVDDGRLDLTERLFVVASDFYGSWWMHEGVTTEISPQHGETLTTLRAALHYVRAM